jgi:Ricin-type beta-trefoil lectin domain
MKIRQRIVRCMAITAVTLTAVGGCLAAGSGPARASTPAANQILLNKNSSLCLGSGGSSDAGTQEIQESCGSLPDTSPDSTWAAEPLPGGRYQVTNGYGLCLGVRGESTLNGAAVEQEACDSDFTSQQWTPGGATAADPDFSYQLVNANSGQCLGIWYAATNAGADAVQWPCNTSPDQRWNGTWFFGNLVNQASGLCAGVSGASKSQNALVVEWTCNTSADQVWEVDPTDFRVENSNDGMCLGVPGGSLNPGVALVQWTCNGNPDQSWPFSRPSGAPYGFQYKDANSGLCLTIQGNKTEPDTGLSLTQLACSTSPVQFWALTASERGANVAIG